MAASPNILLVVIDDMGVHQLGCHGSSFYRTPCIDALAHDGMRFAQAYSTAPVCSPSRASLYTGRHPARLHLTNFIPGTEPDNARLLTPKWRSCLPVEEVTLGDAFKAAGYDTAHFGKWHLAPDYHYRPGRPMDPESQGFDTVHVTRKPDLNADPEADPHHVHEITDRAIAFIQRPRAGPFLCVVAHNALHRPEMAPARLIERFAMPPGASNNGRRPVLAAMTADVDAALGRLLKALHDAGRDRDTIVVFTSDHGAMGRSADRKPLRGAKADLYEGGVRVPLIVRWPGRIASGVVSEVMTQNSDLFPTLCALAGVPADATSLDGRDLRGVLGGDATPAVHEELCWHFPHYHHLGIGPCGAIRVGRHKLVEWFDRAPDGIGVGGAGFELFDLVADPGETRDLSRAEPALCAELTHRLATWRRRVGAQEMERNPAFDPTRKATPPPPPSGDPADPYGE